MSKASNQPYELTISFPSRELYEEFVNAYARQNNYRETVTEKENGQPVEKPNPVSKEQFAKQPLLDIVQDTLFKERSHAENIRIRENVKTQVGLLGIN